MMTKKILSKTKSFDRELLSAFLVIFIFFGFIFVVYPKYVSAGCDAIKSKRCDACYCGEDWYCDYCAAKDLCNKCADAPPPPEPPPATDVCTGPLTPGGKAVCLAETQVGKPWVLSSPLDYKTVPPPEGASGYDCLGLVSWAWYWSNGTDNLRVNMNYLILPSTEVSKAGSKKGDIVNWGAEAFPDCPVPVNGVCSGHVAMCDVDGCDKIVQSYANVSVDYIDTMPSGYRIYKVGN